MEPAPQVGAPAAVNFRDGIVPAPPLSRLLNAQTRPVASQVHSTTTMPAQPTFPYDLPIRFFTPLPPTREALPAPCYVTSHQTDNDNVGSRGYANSQIRDFQQIWLEDNYSPRRSPDSWINAPDYVFYQRPTSTYKPPKLELLKFDGNPLNWPVFIQLFKVQVHDAVASDSERIAH